VPEGQLVLCASVVRIASSAGLPLRLWLQHRPCRFCLVDDQLSVVFYDMTTIRTEGDSEQTGDVRQFGMAKEGVVARQFMLGLVKTSPEGYNLGLLIKINSIHASIPLLPPEGTESQILDPAPSDYPQPTRSRTSKKQGAHLSAARTLLSHQKPCATIT
jgi:hypothetical protein